MVNAILANLEKLKWVLIVSSRFEISRLELDTNLCENRILKSIR